MGRGGWAPWSAAVEGREVRRRKAGSLLQQEGQHDPVATVHHGRTVATIRGANTGAPSHDGTPPITAHTTPENRRRKHPACHPGSFGGCQ